MLTPNNEQLKSLVRWFLAYASGIATGWVGAKNILTPDQLAQVASFFTSETTVSLIVGLMAGVWGLFAHSQTNAVAVVAAMPEVKSVQVEPSPAGIELAKKVGTKPDAVVAVAPGPATGPSRGK